MIRIPRIALRSILGYFRPLPTGVKKPPYRISGKSNQLRQEKAFLRLPW
jgi:hypothetical protein